MNENQKRYLSTLTNKELARIYQRCLQYVGVGTHFGWTLTNLQIVHPQIYQIMQTIKEELTQHDKENAND